MKQRQSIYFSQKKDKDLVEYLEPLVTHYDFNMIAKELMRDGIKYREGAAPSPTVTRNVAESFKKDAESFKKDAQNLPPVHILIEKEEEEIEYEFEDKPLNEQDVLDSLLNMED